MPASAPIQANIDDATQEEAATVLATMGLTVSDAVRIMLTRIAHDHALPFDPLIPNPETISAMEEAQRGNLPSATSIEEFLDAMHAQD